MRAVKAENTAPEMIVRRMAFAMGYRYRLHCKDLPGKPDLVFRTRHSVIFVHGCFWHGHDCLRGARMPKSNRAYWRKKIAGNQARDADNLARLRSEGWKIAVIWECELKDDKTVKKRIKKFLH